MNALRATEFSYVTIEHFCHHHLLKITTNRIIYLRTELCKMKIIKLFYVAQRKWRQI